MASEYSDQRGTLLRSLKSAEHTVKELGLDEDGTMKFLLLAEVRLWGTDVSITMLSFFFLRCWIAQRLTRFFCTTSPRTSNSSRRCHNGRIRFWVQTLSEN